MSIQILALVGVTPERIAALTAAGYAVREIFRQSDRAGGVVRFPGLRCSRGAGTRHLVNADVLTALGPKGYLVNIGRGTVVDTEALIDAVRSKRIAGAGLDVVEGEPNLPPKLPELLQLDSVVITPHIAGRAPDVRRKRAPRRPRCFSQI